MIGSCATSSGFVANPDSLISVIIPTRNAAREIEECLRSLQSQGFRRYDVHVIDAASTDNTLAMVARYQDLLGVGVHCWSEPGSSIYAAMNIGIARSCGEWLYFLGADDVLHDADVLADVASVLAEGDADTVYGDVILGSTGARYGGEFSLERLLFEGNICHQAIFYRRSVFEKIGRFNPRYPIWADWELNIRCFRHTELRNAWIKRLIAVYNDASGQSRHEDPEFGRELPVTLRRALEAKIAALTAEIAALMAKRSYRVGKTLFGWLD